MPRPIRFGNGWSDFNFSSQFTVHAAHETQDGIFDALKHRYLASFQFSLHDGDRSLDTVAQSYVMKFNYSQNGGDIDIGISSGGQTVEVAAKDMQNLKAVFNRLIKMSREAGGLPGTL